MPELPVSTSVEQRVALLARAWGVTKGEAVERLLDEFQGGAEAACPVATAGGVPVHAVYGSTRVEGLFDPASNGLQITTGPLAGKAYRTPSGAAIAVVSLHNRAVNPNRNGWSFWLVSETGERLQTLRRTR